MSSGPKAMTRHELDRTQCGTPGCSHEDHSELWLHSTCHPRAGFRVCYKLVDGTLEMRCRMCQSLITVIAVAATQADTRQVS